MYLMFGFNYIEGGAWNDDGIKAVARFLDRVERLIDRVAQMREDAQYAADGQPSADGKDEKELRYVLANTISHVSEDLERFMFNTAIARLMELVNALYRYKDVVNGGHFPLLIEAVDKLILCMAPFAPHFSEEMHARMGGTCSVFQRQWPTFDEADLVRDLVTLAVQINGKVRARIEVEQSMPREEVQQVALADAKVQAALEGHSVQKVIVVPGRVVNIVAR